MASINIEEIPENEREESLSLADLSPSDRAQREADAQSHEESFEEYLERQTP